MTRCVQEISGKAKSKYSFYSWDRIDGIRVMDLKNGTLTATKATTDEPTDDPIMALDWAESINNMPDDSILFLKDFHHYAKKDAVSRKIRNLVPVFKSKGKVLVIISHLVDIPAELEKEVTVVRFSLPDTDDLRIVLKATCENGGAPYPKDDEPILKAALGMTSFEAENAFAVSLIEKKTFDESIVRREKAAIVKKTGLLEVIETDLSLKDVGGLDALKSWLKVRENCFTEKAHQYGIRPPKGLLLVGVPGTGKTLSAKTIASIWHRPLLRMDVAKMYGQYVGESEGNIRKGLQIAEAVSPCILFLDELEKAFAGAKGDSSGDSGVGKRVFGSFLTWLSDKTSDVFVVATANNVTALPPELLRGGRFEAIFWVDLPDVDQRKEIIKIHLEKVGRKHENYDLDKLARVCKDFTGAEIEVWIREALVIAYSQGKDMGTDHLTELVSGITPIAKLMAADINSSRKWAQDHGVKYASSCKIKEEEPLKRKITLTEGVGG